MDFYIGAEIFRVRFASRTGCFLIMHHVRSVRYFVNVL